MGRTTGIGVVCEDVICWLSDHLRIFDRCLSQCHEYYYCHENASWRLCVVIIGYCFQTNLESKNLWDVHVVLVRLAV